VLREEMRWNLDVEIDRVRRFVFLRHRERDAPLEPGCIMDRDTNLSGERVDELHIVEDSACHYFVTQLSRARNQLMRQP
jgi:hypothetical protein